VRVREYCEFLCDLWIKKYRSMARFFKVLPYVLPHKDYHRCVVQCEETIGIGDTDG